MESRALWIAFFVTIQFSAVLGENPFKEYFYNKYHHKGHHSTEDISSVSENDDTSVTPPILQYGDYYESSDAQKNILPFTLIAIGCFLFLALCSGCICFCIRRSRRQNRTLHGRVVVTNRPGTAPEALPEQSLLAQQRVLAQQQQQPQVMQQYLQPVTTQHYQQQQFSSGYEQDPSPYYQSHPVQQQHPPVQSSQNYQTQDESHNPPEVPPPYEFPEKF